MKQVIETVPEYLAGNRKLGLSDYSYLRLQDRPFVAYSTEKVRTVDLYSGVGSLSLGIWEACRQLGLNFIPSAAVDIDPLVLAVYRINFVGANTIQADLSTQLDGQLGSPPSKNESIFLSQVGYVDFLLSGSPCQGFSPLNNRTRGKDERNALYLRSARFVELSSPRHFLFENVPDVMNGHEDVVGMTLDTLRDLGYNTDNGVIDLSYVGVPQVRKRHILVGSLTKRVSISEVIDAHKVSKPRSVRWAISDIENEVVSGIFTSSSKLSHDNHRRITYLHQKGLYDLPNRMRPRCHRRKHSYKSMYGRLRYEIPAQTITSGFGSPGQGRFIHPTQMRTLTPHEAARLQFFPDFFDFSIVKSRTALSRMIGNAVPMKLSYMFGLHLLGGTMQQRSSDNEFKS